MIEENNNAKQELKPEQEFRDISCLLWTEIKKDWLFFGLSGFVVMCFFLIEDFFSGWLPVLGPRMSESFADELFIGHIAFGAFGLLSGGVAVAGLIKNILYCFDKQSLKLNVLIEHVEHRLRQLTSATTSFAAGVISLALLHAIVTVTSTGLILAGLTFFFMIFIYILFVLVHFVTRRIEPFKDRQLWDKWWLSALLLVLILAITFLCLAGYPLYMVIFTFVVFICSAIAKRLWRKQRQ